MHRKARSLAFVPGWVAIAASLLGVECSKDEEPNWVQFNRDGDTLQVEVGVAEELDAVRSVLISEWGVEIGEATVSPGGGPIGTLHRVLVVVGDDWENEVGRVTVRIDSGERGIDEYELTSDAADEGTWGIEIESQGSEGEQRTDTLTFRLWYDDQESSSGDDTAA
ncbi:MAG: hypothetical protein ABIO70_16390 [Pseudomonadota bacterium]